MKKCDQRAGVGGVQIVGGHAGVGQAFMNQAIEFSVVIVEQAFRDRGAQFAAVSAGAVAVGAVAFELSPAGLGRLGENESRQDQKGAK